MAPSLLRQAKELEQHVNRIMATYDLPTLSHAEQKAVATLKNQLIDARLDVRDYELAETRAEQLEFARAGRAHIEELQKSILKASEYHLLGATDVAHISALADHLHDELS